MNFIRLNYTDKLLLILSLLLVVDFFLICFWVWNEDRKLRNKKSLLSEKWSLLDIFLGTQLGAIVFVIFILTFYLLMFNIGGGKLSTVDSVKSMPNSISLLFLVGATLIQQIFFIVISGFFIRVRFRLNWSDVGLKRLKAQEVFSAFGYAIALLFISSITTLSTQFFLKQWIGKAAFDKLQGSDMSERTSHLITTLSQQPQYILGILIFTSLLAPLSEEILFRSLIFNAFKYRFTAAVGMLASAMLFAAAHGSIVNYPTLFMMGVCLAYAYNKTGSLWVPIFAHGMHNMLASFTAFYR